MFEASAGLVEEFAELERRLADPAIHADPVLSRKVGRRYAELTPIVKNLDAHQRLTADLAASKELAELDPAFAEEAQSLAAELVIVEEKLTRLLAPRDPNDSADALIEIKSGEGGEESALFAGDLFRMYARYAELRGWKVEVLDSQETDLGGYKSITAAVKATGAPDPENAPYGVLKFEGGVHRVQRVPVTESQGRVHTSAAGVLVMPDVEATEVEINDDDLRVDVYRSSGPGGQGVNTTDSAVRITHLPSGIVVSCQNERSQLQNKDSAMRMLRSRLVARAEEEAASAASAARKSQVRTVDRSERIRTYNFPENRIADHRIGFKAYNLDQVLAGELSAVIQALLAADLAERLQGGTGMIAVAALVTEGARQLGSTAEARTLLAHAAGVEPAGLALLAGVGEGALCDYRGLVARRCAGEPVQYLTGRAGFRTIEVAVAPGVFIPRPETEVMTGWAIDQLALFTETPVVVELCAGSGAISLAIATEAPGVRQYAVELSPVAAAIAQRNLDATPVMLLVGDMADAFPELDGTVDLVIANPPYVPQDDEALVGADVRAHEPAMAVFAGADGLSAMPVVADVAARLLRPGGRVCVEHAEEQAGAVRQLLSERGFDQLSSHRDLTGRPRFVTGVRAVNLAG